MSFSNSKSGEPEKRPPLALESILSQVDPLGIGRASAEAFSSLVAKPQTMFAAGTRFMTGMLGAASAATSKVLGEDVEGPETPGRKDRRFADPVWKENPAYFSLLQGYLLWSKLVTELVEEADIDEVSHEKVRFGTEVLVDALAPTNFLATNPAAQKKALDTGGLSLFRGARTFIDDVATNRGLPRHVRKDAFTVGKDLAVSPGKVVFRNALMELIQYAPTTEKVHEVPILISPPWINKYYIVDMSPGRSFVEWAVSHGHTVFCISYHNPTSADRDVSFDDYLERGPLAALDVIQDITGSDQVNLVGICLGGTLTAMMQSYLAEKGDDRVRSATFLNTLTDFSKPGRLAAFTDERSLEYMEDAMSGPGYLESTQMMNTFTFMRSNDLVWNYVVNNWLMGEDPPPFDILSWNGDGTRMPECMHSYYVRSCYRENAFANGTMKLGGVTLDPSKVTDEIYVLAAQEDHITVWKGSYLTTQVMKNAKPRFVLTSSGHIAGIINPPTPKAWYRTGDESLPADPDAWYASSTHHVGSWWEDWAEWIGARAGKMVAPPGLGSEKHKPIEDAPGTYVLEK